MPTLTRDDILALIPHRDTMLLVDGVSDYDLHAKTLTAFKRVKPHAPSPCGRGVCGRLASRVQHQHAAGGVEVAQLSGRLRRP